MSDYQQRTTQLVAAAAIIFIVATVEARIPAEQSTNDRIRSTIYKNVRPTLIKSMIAAEEEKNTNIRGSDDYHQGRRKTRVDRRQLTPLETRCFTECIEQNLSPNECAQYIQNEINNAGGHEVGDVVVKIQTPRAPEIFGETYWMVEVPVNVDGEMTCDRNHGHTYYPYQWSAHPTADVPIASDLPVKNINCQGLTAGECCLAIRQNGQTELGGRDIVGYCLGCFAHIEPLVPIKNDATGLVEYIDYTYFDNKCTKMTLTANEVDRADAVTKAKMEAAVIALDRFLNTPNCVEFETLLGMLYDAAIAIHPLSELIGQLSCTYCYDPNGEDGGDGIIENLSLTDPLIVKIRQLLKSHIPSSKEKCIIIYTDKNGEILNAPKLGGSRADKPYQVEEDCEDEDSN